MMADSNINLSISKEIVEPIVQAKIQAAIVEALGNQAALIDLAARKVLEMKVDNEGKANRDAFYNHTPLVQWLFVDAVKSATRAAIDEIVASKRTKIKDSVAKLLTKRAGGLAASIMDAVDESVKNARIGVSVSLNDKKV